MKLEIINIYDSLKKTFLYQCPYIDEINIFKKNYWELIKLIQTTDNEETIKDYLNNFLRDTYYKGKFLIKENHNNIDLVILNGNNKDAQVGVIVETKALKNTAEMITTENFNKKAFHELILYYLEERIINKNFEIKNLIITNSIDWYIFNANEFEQIFYQNKLFIKNYNEWNSQQLVSKNKDWFYSEIIKPFIENSEETIVCTHFQLFENFVDTRTVEKTDQEWIELYKIFSPEHLLKLPFQNDSNSLNLEFYNELLHILGLYETNDNLRKIVRLKKQDRKAGSMLENVIAIIENDDILDKISDISDFENIEGLNKEELTFSIALELSITWLNRILFLKLLEGQLLKYNQLNDNSKLSDNLDYAFLNTNKIKDFEDLTELFFDVLAVKPQDRKESLQQKYQKIPYLNSSLFELTELEKQTVKINHLKQHTTLPVYNASVLKDKLGKRLTGSLPLLQYILEFLDSYNFASDYKLKIQEQNKTIINSAVLGLIFEKINGYKDGSFFTPGNITMYICGTTIRKAVVQKFNKVYNWNCNSIKPQLKNKILQSEIDLIEINKTFNSIRICDPAVGSGHFLVSALNELIAIKSELGILCDNEGNILPKTYCQLENDELLITYRGKPFVYDLNDNESQTIQETLFQEKRTLIENCLFGVDINAKSVHICRLRLWIELLKNAYYKPAETVHSMLLQRELETLPNIDINIKTGNSLVSFFKLNGNGKIQTLKQKTTEYKEYVSLYKDIQNKKEKRVIEQKIKEIKKLFAGAVNPADEDYKKKIELENIIGNTPMFFCREDQIQWNMKVKRLQKEKAELEKRYEEKRKQIYYNSIEWRYEFPEVLDENGYFEGFDAIVGNPPYIDIRSVKEHSKKFYNNFYIEQKNNFDLYSLFIQRALDLIKNNGLLSFIVPKPILYNSTFKPIRKIIFENTLNQIFIPDKLVFDKAYVETIMIFIEKNKKKNNEILVKTNDTEIKIIETDEHILGNPIILASNEVIILIKKLRELPKLSEFADIIRGLELGKKTIKQNKNFTENCSKIFAGEAIQKYTFFEDKLIFVDKEEIKPFIKNTDKKFINYPRILMRRVAQEPIATIINEGENYINNLNSVYNLVIKSKKALKNEFFLAVLNSKLIKFFIQKSFSSDEKLFPYLRIEQIKEIPMVNVNKKQQELIVKKVNQILKLKKENPDSDTQQLENEIDKIVYKLYELTPAEIKLIENQ